jgi:uncharacterized membrane protein YeaQ/YmgE (transglycosylase-associated protein family)
MANICVSILFGAVTGCIGCWIAHRKGRDKREGFILGFLFSIVGVMVEAFLPKTRGAK